MNIERAIKNNFDFLKKHGFRRKGYSTRGDEEFVYSGKKCTIGVFYFLTSDHPIVNGASIKEIMKDTYYFLEIRITRDGQSASIFDCALFEKYDLEMMWQEICGLASEEDDKKAVKTSGRNFEAPGKNIEQVLKTIGDFVSRNIDKLI